MTQHIKDSKILITGLARDCGITIKKSISIIDKAFEFFKERHWIIIESDSKDNTLNEIRSISSEISMKLISLGKIEEKFPGRLERLAHCRNVYLNEINKKNYDEFSYVAVVDLDGVNDSLLFNSVKSCWEIPFSWDACFANQSAPYYDIFALRKLGWISTDYSQLFERLLNKNIKKRIAMNYSLKSKIIKIPPSFKPIRVDSAFGGLGIYKKKLFKESKYSNLDFRRNEISEHVGFHLNLKKIKPKLFINPKLINGGWNEHTKRVKFHYFFSSFLRKFLKRKKLFLDP